MALEFVGDAISLSGLTGSKLKCDVIGGYYPFWWSITSGGPRKNYEYPTAIVELDAATGEVYIEDTRETILGSAGHALELKCTSTHARNLKLILVEKDAACYARLKRVIGRRWGDVDIQLAERPLQSSTSNIHLLNQGLDSALSEIEKLKLGNALFFFDPLRSVEYGTITKIASKRIDTFYKRWTEFILFVFTSDWFLGRDDAVGLPRTPNEDEWTPGQQEAVAEANAFFGDIDWQRRLLEDAPIEQRQAALIELYKNRLHRWFRYVLPLPFNPKPRQVFHLLLCSNFATGVRATRNFYSAKTGNPKYSPDSTTAFNRFQCLHPDIFAGISGRRRPLQWRILWKTIAEHEEGICDCMCSDFEDIEANHEKRQQSLDWLEENEYLERFGIDNAWKRPIVQYKLNWRVLGARLCIDPPLPLRPLSATDVGEWKSWSQE